MPRFLQPCLPHITQDSSISEPPLPYGASLPTLSPFPGCRASAGEGKTNRPADRAEKRQQQAHLDLPLRLRHTAQFLGACQAGLLFWHCLPLGRWVPRVGGRERLVRGQGAGLRTRPGSQTWQQTPGCRKPRGKGHWSQQSAHPPVCRLRCSHRSETSQNHCLPSPQAPQSPGEFSGLPILPPLHSTLALAKEVKEEECCPGGDEALLRGASRVDLHVSPPQSPSFPKP